MVFVQIFLTILCQACPELLQTVQKKRLRKYIRDDMKRNHPGKNKTERPQMERGKGGGVRYSACTTAKRKIGRGWTEITCKNNNGREYRITRPPAFLPVIGFRVRERKKEREGRGREREREREREDTRIKQK